MCIKEITADIYPIHRNIPIHIKSCSECLELISKSNNSIQLVYTYFFIFLIYIITYYICYLYNKKSSMIKIHNISIKSNL